jgi:hypothetical protein
VAELLQLLDQPTGVRLAVAAAVPIRSKIAVGLVPLEHRQLGRQRGVR